MPTGRSERPIPEVGRDLTIGVQRHALGQSCIHDECTKQYRHRTAGDAIEGEVFDGPPPNELYPDIDGKERQHEALEKR